MLKEIRVMGGSITTGEKDRKRVIEVLELFEAVLLYASNLDESVNPAWLISASPRLL